MRRQAIETLLPAAYRRSTSGTPDGPLGALLDVMAALHQPSEERLDAVGELFAPYRTPDAFVPFLAGWVALGEHLTGRPGAEHLPVPVGRLRDLVAAGASLAQWRGTAHGLRAVIELATGLTGVLVEEPADRPFHVVVRLPAAGEQYLDFVRHVVSAEKAAATTCDVVVDRPSQPERSVAR